MLVEGKWQEKWNPFQKTGKTGDFIRQTSTFRNWITPDGSAGKTGAAGFKAEPGRYHVYIARICPWASRVLMAIRLKGLEDVISISIVNPKLGENGWEFSGFNNASEDHIHGKKYLHELYSYADPKVNGRATVPVLWDKKTDTLVNNESADIIEMLNSAFDQWATRDINWRPESLVAEISDLNQYIYHNINNGVYKAGFAQTQEAYEDAVNNLFQALDQMEQRLADNTFLFGDTFTESDIRLFVTLIRFDVAYFGLFKCNIRRIADYPNLHAYMNRIYALDGIKETVDIEHIKHGYYSIKALNPTGIVPVGPETFV